MTGVSRETGVGLAWRWAAVGLAVWCAGRVFLAALVAWPLLNAVAVVAVLAAVYATRPRPGAVEVAGKGHS
jgi:hypothetical protein